MISGVLMLILTVTEGGQYSAAFVNTPTLAACEQRAQSVRAILEQGDVQIEQLVCRSSMARFEPFVHGSAPGKPRQHYVITLADSHASVAVRAPGQRCENAGTEGVATYCATSTQALLNDAAS